MEDIAKKWYYVGLGIIGYIKDNFEEILAEAERMGKEKSEDLADFLEDLHEAVVFQTNMFEKDGAEDEGIIDGSGSASAKKPLIDVKSTIAGLLKDLGAATKDDVAGFDDKIADLKKGIAKLRK